MLKSTLAVVATLATGSAHAQTYYYSGGYAQNYDITPFVILGFAVLVGIAIVAAVSSDRSSGETAIEETAESLDQDAARMRALTRKLEAETAYRKVYLDAARVKAEVDDLDDVLRGRGRTKQSRG